MTSVIPSINDPITTGDLTASVMYHIMDAEGSLWRSAPTVLVDALRADGIHPSSGSVDASGEWLRIPTLRHLLPGTVAQIEIYIQRDLADRQLFRTIANDPTVDYVDFFVEAPLGWDGSPFIMSSVTDVLAAAGPGEDDYTIGDALANDPPPQFQCLAIWRNRAIGCYGNSIYPSQEFAAGLGIQWSNDLRVQWTEGTGDIIACCPIDWNYFAVFKQDAIGIISGPGPDGLGHGNFIVQTLATKMGTNIPAGVVNGADGCYFQDSQTGRLAVITPQLNPQECMLGWFNTEGAIVTCAIQVEQLRQVWFGTNDGQIIVLDYKHKTQGSPFGQVFTWDVTGFGSAIMDMAIIGGLPTVLFLNGKTAQYFAAQPVDQLSDATVLPILQKMRTGALQPANLQGMFDVCRVQFLGEFVEKHGFKMTVYSQYATSGTAVQLAVTAGPEQFVHRPGGCQRVQSIEVEIEELTTTSGTPPATVYGKGFKFNGLALEIQSRGKLQEIAVGRIV